MVTQEKPRGLVSKGGLLIESLAVAGILAATQIQVSAATNIAEVLTEAQGIFDDVLPIAATVLIAAIGFRFVRKFVR